MIQRRKQKRDKKRNWTGKKGRGGIPIIIPATEGSKLAKEMRKVAENVSKENPDILFSIVERGGVSIERMLMDTNPTESNVCGRDCFVCNQEGGDQKRNMCRKSNSSLTQKNVSDLERVQKSAVRIIFGKNYESK